MATFLNTVLSNVLQSLETEYNVYEVYDADDANVVLNDVQEASFPVAFFSIKNNGAITLTRHKKSYPVYDVAIWLLNLYREDDKAELETNYEGLRLDALEFLQRFQRTTAFSRVPTNTVLTPRVEEFDAQLDLLATAVQITFTASIDIEEDTSRVCAPLSISSFTLNDTDFDAVVLDASASSYRGTVSGSTAGTHNWSFVMNGTSVSISGLATSTLSASDIASLATIGMINATGTYNSFTFEKNPDSVGSFNFIISVSHTYDFRGSGDASTATTATVRAKTFLSLFTTWETSVDGPFNPTIAGGTKTWIFGTDTATGDNPNYSGSYLDGTLKSVIIDSEDFSLVNLVTLTDYKLTGVLDVSLLTGSPSFTAQTTTAVSALNNSFTSIIAPAEAFSVFTIAYYQGTDIELATDSNFRVNSSPNLETVTITGGTTAQIFFVVCPSLTSFTHLGTMAQGLGLNSTPNIANITITSGASSGTMNFRSILGSVDFGSYVINDFTSFVFGESGTTTASLDQAWIEIDRVATVTGIARTIDGSRATASPSATSLTARNSLISKGYTLLI